LNFRTDFPTDSGKPQPKGSMNITFTKVAEIVLPSVELDFHDSRKLLDRLRISLCRNGMDTLENPAIKEENSSLIYTGDIERETMVIYRMENPDHPRFPKTLDGAQLSIHLHQSLECEGLVPYKLGEALPWAYAPDAKLWSGPLYAIGSSQLRTRPDGRIILCVPYISLILSRREMFNIERKIKSNFFRLSEAEKKVADSSTVRNSKREIGWHIFSTYDLHGKHIAVRRTNRLTSS
jgi:hypothetical protein